MGDGMTHVETDPVDFRRRKFVQLSGIVAGLSILETFPLTAYAASPTETDFLAVSKALVGKRDLSEPFGIALLSAFRKTDPAFDGKLLQLRQKIGDSPVDGDTLKASLVGAGADLAALPQAILSGWYLGIVGSGQNAICVAYVDALANRAVADVLRPQSYSYGAYGSWASKPV